MKKLLCILAISSFFVFFKAQSGQARAQTRDNKNDISIEDMVDNLNTDAVDELLNSLTSEQKDLFGASDIKNKLLMIIKGNDGGIDNFITYIFSSATMGIKKMLPLMFSVLGICVAFGIINAFGDSLSSSVAAIVKFVFILLISIIVFSQVMSVIISTKSLVNSLKRQIDVIFPILMTLMAAVGSSKTIIVYQPAVAVLSSGLTQIITVFVLPCFILSMVLEISGHFSDKIKLKNMASFFSGSMKWLLSTAFFVFLSFLSIKGITASIYDSMYIRTTKFALNKYVPIIGSYLSEGYNLVFSGSVIIKNGVGLSAIVLLVITVLPLCFQILIFGLCLDLLAALVEPIGAGEAASIFKGLSKNVKNLLAIIFGIAFLYFIFVLLIICTGNSVL